MIATWPNHIKPGTQTDHISAHYDVMATLFDLLDVESTLETDGISFLPTLMGENVQAEHDFLYWEFPEYGGQVAIRMGDWKVVRQNLKNPEEEATLELYNLAQDPAELNNVAEENPEIIAKASEIFAKEHTNSEVERFRIPLIEEGLLADVKD